jgi:hypothetical protein
MDWFPNGKTNDLNDNFPQITIRMSNQAAVFAGNVSRSMPSGAPMFWDYSGSHLQRFSR